MGNVNNFFGGLNVRADASKLAPNEAVEFVNIDNTEGTLKSAKAPMTVELMPPLELDNTHVNVQLVNSASGNVHTVELTEFINVVEYQGNVYLSDSRPNSTRPQRIYPTRVEIGEYEYTPPTTVTDTTYQLLVYDRTNDNLYYLDSLSGNTIMPRGPLGLDLVSHWQATVLGNIIYTVNNEVTSRGFYNVENNDIESIQSQTLSTLTSVYLSGVYMQFSDGFIEFTGAAAGLRINLNGLPSPNIPECAALVSGNENYSGSFNTQDLEGGSVVFHTLTSSGNRLYYGVFRPASYALRPGETAHSITRVSGSSSRLTGTKFIVKQLGALSNFAAGSCAYAPTGNGFGIFFYKSRFSATVHRANVNLNTGVISSTSSFTLPAQQAFSSLGVSVRNQERIFNPAQFSLEHRINDLSISEPIDLGLPQPRNPIPSVDGAETDRGLYTFPTDSEFRVSSNYRRVDSIYEGEASFVPNSPRDPFRESENTTFNFRLDIVTKDAAGVQQSVVSRNYSKTLTDFKLYNDTPPAQCRLKGTNLGFIYNNQRVECRRSEHRFSRVGLVIDLEGYEGKDIRVNVIDDAGEAREIGIIRNNSDKTLVTRNFISVANNANYADNVDHSQTINYQGFIKAPTDSASDISGTCTVQYTYTYYDRFRDIESAPAPFTAPLELSRANIVTLNGIPVPPGRADTRIWRLCPELGETVGTLIGTIVNSPDDSGTVSEGSFIDELGEADLGGLTEQADGTLVSIRDAEGGQSAEATPIVSPDGTPLVPETDIRYQRYISATGAVLNSYDFQPPSSSITYLAFADGALFGIDGRRLRWSILGLYDYWPSANFLDFDDEITGILAVSEGLLVFTLRQTHIVRGVLGTTQITRATISQERGCIHPRSCKYVRGVPTWLSTEGITTFNNGRADVISRAKLGDVELQNVITCEVHNEVYYVLYNPEKRLNGETNSAGNILLGYDLRYIEGGSFTEYEIPGLSFITTYKNDSSLYGTVIANGNKQLTKLFEGTEDLTLRYKSPVLTGGVFSRVKSYEKFYARYETDSPNGFQYNITLYSQSRTGDFPRADLLSDKQSAETSCPQGRWYGIQFDITGEGKFIEFEWEEAGSSSRKQNRTT